MMNLAGAVFMASSKRVLVSWRLPVSPCWLVLISFVEQLVTVVLSWYNSYVERPTYIKEKHKNRQRESSPLQMALDLEKTRADSLEAYQETQTRALKNNFHSLRTMFNQARTLVTVSRELELFDQATRAVNKKDRKLTSLEEDHKDVKPWTRALDVYCHTLLDAGKTLESLGLSSGRALSSLFEKIEAQIAMIQLGRLAWESVAESCSEQQDRISQLELLVNDVATNQPRLDYSELCWQQDWLVVLEKWVWQSKKKH